MRAASLDLASRTRALASAIEAAEGRLPEPLLERARGVLARASERAELSSEHTVVALAGATGAGKSSVFNALVGSEVARTSEQRPTTAHALAVVAERAELRAGSDELLAWLEVPARHERPIDEDHPDGLVLLDLPDHDSVVRAHRERADHVTQRADLLVWVTNPQKYADAVLHERYLAPLAGHGGDVVVVLNQIDRLSAPEAAACLDDLERLVRADGLSATVLGVSARTGAGLPALRRLVVKAVERRQVATGRLVADIRGVANELAAAVPPATDSARAARAARGRLVDTLEQAAGVPLVVEAVRVSSVRDAVAHTGWPPTRWVQRLRADPLRTLGLRGSGRVGRPGGTDDGAASSAGLPADEDALVRTSVPPASPAVRAQVATAARAYVQAAAAALPAAWGERLNAAVVGRAALITDALDVAVARGVRLRPARWWRAVGSLQWLLLAVLVVGLLWLAGLALVDYLRLPQLPDPVLTVGELVVPWPTLLSLGGALLGIAVAAIARIGARVGAARRARAVGARLRRAVEDVAQRRLLAEVDGELTAAENLRAAAVVAAA
ncbi:GTPase family protein [Miniimonas sp. S16]|uniref:GTPase family protein n=1 Tax=Miniimonas sp. S16 TaxID=2171623 RepID=UPI000D52637A|nr:GTPase [Miniimonas sp. S16]